MGCALGSPSRSRELTRVLWHPALNPKFARLRDLAAGDFKHIDGTLLDHLVGTRELLARWGASQTLQDAGLYHAAYGTAGFGEQMVSVSQRASVASVIGANAEQIVYQYCACDREYFWPQFGLARKLVFRDRFRDDYYLLDDSNIRSFCELTVANELEIASGNPRFIAEHGHPLSHLFEKMLPYLTHGATTEFRSVLM